MESEEYTHELLAFFKALADANRLKIVGLLAQQPLSVEQIAEILNLNASTVSHHLARLNKAGLVTARADGYYNMYQLETKALESMAQRLLAKETLPAIAAEINMDAYDKKVLQTYLTPDGKLKAFPMQQKKFEVILRHAVRFFEPGQRYSEKQVNDILRPFNEDTARLRRSFIEYGLMQRQGGGGEYWRVDEEKSGV
ncbi:MAG: metalloregulator ArsR/SmtB family transcription factor [Chloroflexi bacterium]|nr:metalloregulator ArsR/SmtB family transcription factor [Chloroflexota bacterium]MBP8058781.1 metalloregulator ArsR/SmtB family transcription factor [Chloroflexota bacterium]